MCVIIGFLLQIVLILEFMLSGTRINIFYAFAVAWIVPSIYTIYIYSLNVLKESMELGQALIKKLTMYFALCGAIVVIGVILILRYYSEQVFIVHRLSVTNNTVIEVESLFYNITLLYALLFTFSFIVLLICYRRVYKQIISEKSNAAHHNL